jgi:hypothetical protein
MVYPKPQYADPILMDAENYRWLPVEGASGVEEKALGTFTDCKIRSAVYKLSPGAKLTGTGRGIYFVLSGRGTVESQPMRRYTSVYLKRGETATFAADETAVILLLGLPDVALMRPQPVSEKQSAAA